MSPPPEAHRHFHEELSQVKVRLLTMSGEAEAALRLAVEALLERNPEKARRVIAGDRIIDGMEVEIEEACIDLLALQQPMAKDLRMLVAAIKIANDLERVGDHAVNLAQSADRLASSRPIAPEPEIVEMARLAREMLSDALEAFVRGDAAAGRDVCRRDAVVALSHDKVCKAGDFIDNSLLGYLKNMTKQVGIPAEVPYRTETAPSDCIPGLSPPERSPAGVGYDDPDIAAGKCFYIFL